MSDLAGRHLILDCVLSPESASIVSSRECMCDYLDKVTDITGMTLVFPPFALKFPYSSETHRLVGNLKNEGMCGNSPVLQEFMKHLTSRDTEGSGVSAMSMWLESHCSLHSWTECGYISIDLFSCKIFESSPVIDFTKEFMKLEKIHVTQLDRYMKSTPVISNYSV